MKNYIIAILLAIFAIPSFGQSISIFDIDTTNFPTMKAKFYAFDKDGKQVTPSTSDMKLTENGVSRKILNISCPAPEQPTILSSVLVLDVSGSMSNNLSLSSNMDIAKAGANAWVNSIPLNVSECAITSFDDKNYLNQDFTNDKNLLLNAISPIAPKGGTNYNAGFIEPMFGGLQITKNAKHQKVIVFLTDGQSGGNEISIINEAKKQNCQIFCIVIGMPAPKILQNISSQTGGMYFENITTKEAAEIAYKKILFISQNRTTCELEWESEYNCTIRELNVELNYNNLVSNKYYITPKKSLISLNVIPNYIRFGERVPNMPYDTTIKITAINSTFTIQNFKSKFGSNNFQIVNTTLPVIIQKNTSIEITLRFMPMDSSLDYSTLEIETDLCNGSLSAYGGYNEKRNNKPSLQLIKPNGNEYYIVGSDTMITWTGVAPQDTVILDYSIDSGKTWKNISKNATGLEYKWENVPKPTSSKCLVRVKIGDNFFPPKIEWTKNYGGTSSDEFSKIIQTRDGGYAFIGASFSNDVDLNGNRNVQDYWFVKLNELGIIEWQKTLGGNNLDYGVSLQQTDDDGFILSGLSWSTDLNGMKGIVNILVYKLDKFGNVIWQNCYGGSQYDSGMKIIQTNDFGYMLIGIINSNDGDIKINKGGEDCWIVKLNNVGDIEWEKSFGGSQSDEIFDIIQTVDNGYIFIGSSMSKDGDFSNQLGEKDVFVIKIDSIGNKIWSKKYGGTLNEHGRSIRQTNDGGYAFIANTSSNDIDVKSKNNVKGSFWIVKINRNGIIEWENTFGGVDFDEVSSFDITNDGGYILNGYTSSRNSGQITDYKDSVDIWVVKVDGIGKIEWQKTLGGTGQDMGNSIIQTSDNGFIVGGTTFSNNIDVLTNYGSSDIWIAKLYPDRVVLQQDISDTLFSIVAPSPASSDIDMKKCIVSRAKDSTINNFIINKDKYQFGVDSIYFSGADAGAFSLVSGLPKYKVLGNSKEFAEIRFIPNRVGLHSAKVNIITTFDTLVQNIIGEGVASGIEVINNLIDFGNVSLSKFKDSLQAVTIRNISASDILITNIKQSGPNYSDFSILSNTTNLLLKAGDTLRLDLKYTPSFDGKVNGSLSFEFNEIGSPAYVQLYGRGIDAKAILSADSSSAFMRKEAKVILRLTNIDKLIDVGNTHISAELVYNKTMLYPKTIMSRFVEGDSIVIKLDSLPLVANSNNLLKELKFTATLGNAEETALNLRNVKMIGADADVTVLNGNFKLLGVCYEGGERFLVGNKSKSMLLSILPNPATESIEIEYSNADEGEAEIIISNLLGQTILTQKLEKTQTGKTKLDLSQLPTGHYSIIFKTETVLENRVIQVIK